MENKERTNGKGAFGTVNKVNLTSEVCDILKTMLMLRRPYGFSYIALVLTGKNDSPWMKKEHREFETFGKLKHMKWDEVRNIMLAMNKDGLIAASNRMYNTFEITEIGKAFLNEPSGFELSPAQLRTKKHDLILFSRLKALRANLAKSKSLQPWRVMSEFSLLHIVAEKPATFAELQVIPGMGIYRAEQFGPAILSEIRKVEEEKDLAYLQEYYRKALSPSLQQTRALFNQGKSPEEISKLRKLSPVTVKEHLEALHLAGEIDMRDWIEKTVEGAKLYKGAEYFRKVQRPRLKEAYEVLGLDYDTLQMCKLYVADVKTARAELRI